MPIGITINSLCVFVGGFIGSRLGRFIPERTQKSLSLIFGFCSVAIGISLIGKIHSLPAVTLALILGTIIGEGVRLEDKLAAGAGKMKNVVEKISHHDSAQDDVYIEKFISLLMLFCTGSTGILGALGEGMTGEITVLLTKSVMDLFASACFAASMGVLVMLIAIPQYLLFLALFLLAGVIMPLANPAMTADFMACGGIIAIITGLRICEIKAMRVSNTLPSLILVMPISRLWEILF